MKTKIAFGFLTVTILILTLAFAVVPVRADTAPGYGNASPSGQTHAASNFQNSVYGAPGVVGNGGSLNSSAFGTSGGSGGGLAGVSNSAGAPWGAINKAANNPNP